MALITCSECGREVSDRASACPQCGAPIENSSPNAQGPETVTTDGEAFVATKALLIRHTVKAVQNLNYKVDAVDESVGLVSFTTGMTWGSWSGVSGSVYLDEISPNKFKVSGNAKQNVKGGQVIALNLFGEANGKVNNVIAEMRRIAST